MPVGFMPQPIPEHLAQVAMALAFLEGSDVCWLGRDILRMAVQAMPRI